MRNVTAFPIRKTNPTNQARKATDISTPTRKLFISLTSSRSRRSHSLLTSGSVHPPLFQLWLVFRRQRASPSSRRGTVQPQEPVDLSCYQSPCLFQHSDICTGLPPFSIPRPIPRKHSLVPRSKSIQSTSLGQLASNECVIVA